MTGTQRSTSGIEVARFLRANASSIIATGLEWGLVTSLIALRQHYLVAAGAGAAVGAITDFSLKRHWAFMRKAMGAAGHEAIRYVVAAGASLGLNLLVSYALVEGLHTAPLAGVITASVVVGVAWNYPVQRLFVFPERQEAP